MKGNPVTFITAVQLYNDYIDQLMDTYTTEYLIVKNNKKHVLDFSSFVSHFVNFLKNQQFHTPFTFTSWQRSKSSNIFTSGIAIDIANMDFGIDPEIEDSVLTNPCLPYYFKVCRANGFLVSELAPTVMIADILSPGLEPFANKNRIFTTEDVFLSRYNYAYAADYETMQVKLIDAYNFFVAENPFERLVTSKCLKASSVVLKDRLPTNIIEVEKHFPMKKWLYTYAQIRNNEEQGILDKREFKILLKKIKMMKYVDNFKAMRYINDTFRNTYKSKYGGLNYFIKKTRQQNEEIDSSIESITAGSTDGSNGGSSGGY